MDLLLGPRHAGRRGAHPVLPAQLGRLLHLRNLTSADAPLHRRLRAAVRAGRDLPTCFLSTMSCIKSPQPRPFGRTSSPASSSACSRAKRSQLLHRIATNITSTVASEPSALHHQATSRGDTCMSCCSHRPDASSSNDTLRTARGSLVSARLVMRLTARAAHVFDAVLSQIVPQHEEPQRHRDQPVPRD